jgi:hypothetical protein
MVGVTTEGSFTIAGSALILPVTENVVIVFAIAANGKQSRPARHENKFSESPNLAIMI